MPPNSEAEEETLIVRKNDAGDTTEIKFIASRQHLLTLILIPTYIMVVRFAYVMIAIFLPQEALKFDVHESILGLIFSIFCFASLFTALIIGNHISSLGLKSTMMAGLLIEAFCQILFGFVVQMPSRETFIAFSIIIRIVMGAGSAASACAGIATIIKTFPKHYPFAMGICVTMTTVGVMAGPSVGGFLYTVGGFITPFLVIGCTLALITILIGFTLHPKEDFIQQKTTTKSISVLGVLFKPCIFVSAGTIVIATILATYLNPIFAEHLETFGLSEIQIGLMFLISPGVASIFGPITGRVITFINPRISIAVGGIVLGFTSILFGPAPFLSSVVPSATWQNGVILVFFGISLTLMMVPCVPDMMFFATKRYRYPDNVSTSGVVSAIYTACYQLGSALGPLLSGMLTQNFGFAWALAIGGLAILLHSAVVIVQTIHIKGFALRRSSTKTIESNDKRHENYSTFDIIE